MTQSLAGEDQGGGLRISTLTPSLSRQGRGIEESFINGFVLFAHQSGIDISWSTAIRDVTGYIAEGAGLLAGWALVWHGLGPKRITTIRTFPLRHWITSLRKCGVQNKNISYHFRGFEKISNPPSSPFVKRGKSFTSLWQREVGRDFTSFFKQLNCYNISLIPNSEIELVFVEIKVVAQLNGF